MTRIERMRLPWECTLGKKSHINLVGKIILFPIIISVAGIISILESLFSSDLEGDKNEKI